MDDAGSDAGVVDEHEQFRRAVRRLVEVHLALKEHNLKGKQLREVLSSLKNVVIRYMENASLDICNVTHDGRSGELALRTSKRRKGVSREQAIQQIVQYLTEETSTAADEATVRASSIWECIQQGRSVSEVSELSVRKFV